MTVYVPNGTYGAAVVGKQPVAFYEFNETGDSSGGTLVALDWGNYNGVYGKYVNNGTSVYGPSPNASGGGYPYTGPFVSPNWAVSFSGSGPGNEVTLPAFNLNTNTVTLTAWIKPASQSAVTNAALIFCRSNTTVAGLAYTGGTNSGGYPTLGYNWGNDPATTGWNSGLVAPEQQWSLVGLVITPSNSTVYVLSVYNLYNPRTHQFSGSNYLAMATQAHSNGVQAFDGATLIGRDSGNTAGGYFNGTVDEVAVFNRALTQSDLLSLASAAGISGVAPSVTSGPTNQTVAAGQTAQFSVGASGTQALSYQWQAGVTNSGVYTNLVDGGRIWGSTTAVLSISNAAYADGADYRVVVSNFYGSATSGKATLTVTAPPPVAAFGLSATSVGTGVTVYFTNLTTGVWDSVLWTFGDGASSTGGVANGAVVSHAYSVSNSYTVYLGATNSGAGLGNIASHALLVTNSVSGAVQGNPGFASVKLSGTALTIVITNVAGSAGRPFNLLGTNNVAAARNTWPVVTNGVFAANGGYTNTLQTTNGTRQFYLIQVP